MAQPPPAAPPPSGSGPRPQNVTIAAILLFSAGGLLVLLGLLAFGVLSLFGAGLAIVFGLLYVVLGGGQIWAGVQVMAQREQGRILGLITAGVAALLLLISLFTGFNILGLLILLAEGAAIYFLVTGAADYHP